MIRIIIVCLLTEFASKGLAAQIPDSKPKLGEQRALNLARRYLASRMDLFHSTFDVYTDADAPGNHFVAKARISSFDEANSDHTLTNEARIRNSSAASALVPPMDEAYIRQPQSGLTCIRATFRPTLNGSGYPWGGWYFMNGVLKGQDLEPTLNFGLEPNSGLDLSGATRLTFWAKGEKGGEQVEFFTLGVAHPYNNRPPLANFADSGAKLSTGTVSLPSHWKRYEIDLKGADLHYVLGGFGWAASATQNALKPEIVFYVDQIRFDKKRLDDARFINSYEVNSNSNFDKVMKNVAFSYDNALALMAFLATGDVKRSKLIANAFVYALNHDRFFTDHRIRNAYQSGDLSLPPGWKPGGKDGVVRLPGWYEYGNSDHESGKWLEDEYAVSTHTGNVAWTILALLAFYQVDHGNQYLQTARDMGNWIENNCRDSVGNGYTAGFEGFDGDAKRLRYKATEHNLDLYAAFERLGKLTGEASWYEHAEHARKFVDEMWDDKGGKFYTGTRNEEPAAINEDVIPVDIQAWVHLALREKASSYQRSMAYADEKLRAGEGYDYSVFKTQNKTPGVWFEGTAQMAEAFRQLNNLTKWRQTIEFLVSYQDRSGGIFASSDEKLETGFGTLVYKKTENWAYYRRLHVGATAWFVLALSGVNPFWLGDDSAF